MSVHHVCAEDVQADEVLLTGEADFHFPVPFIRGSAVLHGFFEPGQVGPAQVTQARQRLLSFSGGFFYIGGNILCSASCSSLK